MRTNNGRINLRDPLQPLMTAEAIDLRPGLVLRGLSPYNWGGRLPTMQPSSGAFDELKSILEYYGASLFWFGLGLSDEAFTIWASTR